MGSKNVFISHSTDDKHYAMHIDQVIRENGADTFIDHTYLEGGHELGTELERAIEDCDVFLLLWSVDASQSRWVNAECNIAYDKRKKIVPYRLDSTSLPEFLESFVHVDIRDMKRGHSMLLKAIYGSDYVVKNQLISAGNWEIYCAVMGAAGTYKLYLATNGEVSGVFKTGQSTFDKGINTMMNSMGIGFSTNHMSNDIAVKGSWYFDNAGGLLRLDLVSSSYLGSMPHSMNIYLSKDEYGEISGHDANGVSYSLRRGDEETGFNV